MKNHIIYIINKNILYLNINLLNNDNRYMKVTQKSKLIGVSRELISDNYYEFSAYIWRIRRRGIFKKYFQRKKSASYVLSNTVTLNSYYNSILLY